MPAMELWSRAISGRLQYLRLTFSAGTIWGAAKMIDRANHFNLISKNPPHFI